MKAVTNISVEIQSLQKESYKALKNLQENLVYFGTYQKFQLQV